MSNEEKLLYLFKLIHGEMTGSCSAKVLYDDEYSSVDPKPRVACMKDGNECWSASREELIFDYVTRDLGESGK